MDLNIVLRGASDLNMILGGASYLNMILRGASGPQHVYTQSKALGESSIIIY